MSDRERKTWAVTAKGKKKAVVKKWKTGEWMINGHSSVAECGATGRQRRRCTFFFFFLSPPYGLGSCSSVAHTHTPDPSCHLMPVEHEINRHSWYKQVREQIHSHVQAELQSCRMERSAEEVYRSADEAVASQTNGPMAEGSSAGKDRNRYTC